MKVCSNCGAENRDTANFCSTCRAHLPAASPQLPAPPGVRSLSPVQPPTPQKPVTPTVLGPPSPVDLPLIPSTPYPIIGSTRPPRRLFGRVRFHRGPLAEGRVAVVDPVREARLPFDPGRGMVMLGLTLLGLGACSLIAVVAFAVFVALAILGLGSLCLLPVFLPMVTSLLVYLFYGARGNRSCPLVDAMVEDEISGAPMSIILYLKEGSGSLRLGDRVRVYGHKQWNISTVRAYKVAVYETHGQPTDFTVHGVRPWPLWLGLLTLAGVVAFYVWLFMGGYLPQF